MHIPAIVTTVWVITFPHADTKNIVGMPHIPAIAKLLQFG